MKERGMKIPFFYFLVSLSFLISYDILGADEMLKGSIVALITPFDENNKIDFDELKKLLDFHLENQTDGLLLLGTTAEAEALSENEKVELVTTVLDYLSGRIKVMVGIISNITRNVIELAKLFDDLDIDSYLVITPYYNKSNTSGLLKHFTQIADAVSHPIVIYNVPKRTGMSLEVEVIHMLSFHPNIIGIKEASGNLAYQGEIISVCKDDFVLYCGDDQTVLPSLSLGAVGVISVIGNAFPKEMKLITTSFPKNIEIARSTFVILLPLIKAIFLEVSPIPIKYLLYLMGYQVKNVRMPLAEPSFACKRALEIKYLELLNDN